MTLKLLRNYSLCNLHNHKCDQGSSQGELYVGETEDGEAQFLPQALGAPVLAHRQVLGTFPPVWQFYTLEFGSFLGVRGARGPPDSSLLRVAAARSEAEFQAGFPLPGGDHRIPCWCLWLCGAVSLMGDQWALGRGGRDQGRPVSSPALEGNHHYHLSPPLWAPLSHRHTHTPLFSFDETIKTTQSYHCGLLSVACDTGRKEVRRAGRPWHRGTGMFLAHLHRFL